MPALSERSNAWASQGPDTVLALTGAIALVYGALLVAGPKFSPDSYRYIAVADAIVDCRFQYAEWQTTFTVGPLWTYLGWIVLIALTELLVGPAWPLAIVTINWLAVVTTAYLILSLVQDLTRSRVAVAAAAASIVLADDWLLFMPFVLSDTIFVALSTLLLVSAIRQTVDPPARLTTRPWTVAGILVNRPASPPILALWMLALASARLPRFLTMKRTAVGCAILMAAVVGFHSWAIARPDAVPRALHLARLDSVRYSYEAGMVVAEVPSTYVAAARDVRSVAALTLRKWLAFFWPWLHEFSAFHKALNAAFFIPVYALFVVAAFRSPQRRAMFLLILFVGFVSLFHALQHLDPDYRYRMPVTSALVIGAALGVASLAAGREMNRVDAGEHQHRLA